MSTIYDGAISDFERLRIAKEHLNEWIAEHYNVHHADALLDDLIDFVIEKPALMDTGEATATAADIKRGATACVNGELIEGTTGTIDEIEGSVYVNNSMAAAVLTGRNGKRGIPGRNGFEYRAARGEVLYLMVTGAGEPTVDHEGLDMIFSHEKNYVFQVKQSADFFGIVVG